MGSSPRSRRGTSAAQAGTSIIAALLFAAILGAIALSLNTLRSNSTSAAALPAQASGSVDFNQGCTSVLATAVKNHQNTPQRVDVIQDASGRSIDDSCNGAVSVSEPPAGVANEQDYSVSPPTTYECVGMSGTITYGSQITATLNPDPSVQAGKCSLKCASLSDVSGCATNATFSPSSAYSAAAEGQGYGGGQTTDNTTVSPNTLGTAQGGPLAGTPSGCYDQTGAFTQCPSGVSAGTTVACTDGANCQAAPSACQPGSGYNQSACQTSWYCEQYSSASACTGTPSGSTSSLSPPSECPAGQTGYPFCCPIGQAWNGQAPGQCVTTPVAPAAPAAVAPPALGGIQTLTTTGAGAAGGISNEIGAFATGLARGFAQGLLSPCASPYATPYQSPYIGGNGTTLVPVTTIGANGLPTTVYVQQQTSPYGLTPIPTAYPSAPCGSPLTSAQAPYGVGSNGVACPVPPSQPQCSSGATPMPIAGAGNGCTTSYQCVPTSSTFGQTPTPQISCSPQVADVGQSVAIAYSCTNATGSSGAGFSTNNQMSGSATSVIQAPPSGTNTANYGLTCTNNGQTASAQCSVQINQPSIDLAASPASVQSGQTSTIGWVTAGMQSCVISSPQDSTFTQKNAGNTSVNGSAQTDPITANTEFDLNCTTLGGQTQATSTTVSVGSTTSASSTEPVTVSSTADGQTVNHGGTITITWSVPNPPSDSALALWLIDIKTEQATALIAGDQPTSGSYQWQLPASGSTCDQSSPAPCGSSLVAGDSYGIEAALYTPQNASLSTSVPSGSVAPTYVDYGYTATPFTVGQ